MLYCDDHPFIVLTETKFSNDFIDDEIDSEDVSQQRVSASLSDSVPIELEEERAARESDELEM
jgi:hypothetical protein